MIQVFKNRLISFFIGLHLIFCAPLVVNDPPMVPEPYVEAPVLVSNTLPTGNFDIVDTNQINRGEIRTLDIPNLNSSSKTYMPYDAITSINSIQYQLRLQAYTDEQGFRRINEDYCIALGTYYSDTAGQRFSITLSSGRTFTAITGDIKADEHTDSSNRFIDKGNGNINIIEFLVDINKIDSLSREMGDMSYSGFEGNVVSIEALDI